MGSYYAGVIGSRYDSELKHFGILGMKWGVRRFQNEDGTLTKAGKERYSEDTVDKRTRMKDKQADRASGGSGQNTSIGRRVDDNHSSGKELLDYWRPILKSGETSEYANVVADTAANLLSLNFGGLAKDASRIASAKKSDIDNARYDVERFFNFKKDPETGFKLKSKEMSPEDDLARVNPEYGNWNSNTKNNCVMCTTAYVMRRKGYDVEANKTPIGYQIPDIFEAFPGASAMRFSSTHPNLVTASYTGGNTGYAGDIVKGAEDYYPDGAYGNIIVEWGPGGGHSMFFEIVNGKLIIRDGQTNTTYENPLDILGYTTSIQMIRLDNVDFDPEKIKEFCS